MSQVKTLLVESNRLFREGIKGLLAKSSFDVAAEATNMDEALRLLENGLAVDLVVMDLTGADGEDELMGRLRDEAPEARLVVLTQALSAQRLAEVLEVGADGYLLKDVSSEALILSLRLVMLGEKVFPTDLAGLLSSRLRRVDFGASRPINAGLSGRETEILRCLLGGDSNKVIANKLNITEATVKVHLKSLLRKIKVSNRTQAAIWAMNHGFSRHGQEMRLSA